MTNGDLGAMFDEHVRGEFDLRDVEATMDTMSPEPSVNHIPTLAGGVGRDAVRDFYGVHFIGQWPSDTDVQTISRTVGTDRVVDEVLISFTHDVAMDTFLPGVPPTGRQVRLPLVVIVGFQDGKVESEHIYWDQATLLVQVGLLDPGSGLPVTGVEQAEKIRDPSLPSNVLMARGGPGASS